MVASKRILTIAVALLGIAHTARAQHTNMDMLYQLRSMETAGWKFSPGLYYYVFHKKYSGAKLSGFFKVKFDETRSNVKRTAPVRMAQVPMVVDTKNSLQHQLDSIEPLLFEESLRSTERMVDVIYPLYEETFNSLDSSIRAGVIQIDVESKGKLSMVSRRLISELDEINAQIQYIHRQGPGNEVENTKRQIVYEDAKNRMSELAKSTSRLLLYSKTL